MHHVPPYVYILFLMLLWMGVSRCYPRTIRIERLVIMPVLMTVLGVRGFFGLFPAPDIIDLLSGICGAVIGLAIGYHHVQAWAISINKADRTISVPGDVMMLIVILATFCFEFVLHYVVESGMVLVDNPILPPVAAAIWMLFIGMSVGRNINLASRFVKSETILPQNSQEKV